MDTEILLGRVLFSIKTELAGMKNGIYRVGKYAAKAAVGHERIAQYTAIGTINDNRPEKKQKKSDNSLTSSNFVVYLLSRPHVFCGEGDILSSFRNSLIINDLRRKPGRLRI